MSTLLLTMAGKSTRYPGERPKWSLTDPSGNIMAAESISKIRNTDRIVAGISSTAAAQFSIPAIEKEFSLAGRSVDVFVVGDTRSQVDTVRRLLRVARVTGPFTVKDCDNRFEYTLPDYNAVAYVDLHTVSHIIPGNKSYIRMDSTEKIVDIREKQIISPYFCCGAYSFRDVDEFGKFGRPNDCYVSTVIKRMVEGGCLTVYGIQASDYEDWGTLQDWNRYRSRFRTLFVDIDGVLVESSHRSFYPKWGTTPTIAANIDYLNGLHESGTVDIILVTSRPESHRKETEEQLCSLYYDRLIMGLRGGSRVLVNDVVRSRGERTCHAVNIDRDTDCLEQELKHV